MPHRARTAGSAPIYYDQVPVVSDAGHGMARLCQPDGSDACIMPDDVIYEFAIALLRHIARQQAQRAGVVVPFAKPNRLLNLVSLGVDE